MSISISNLLFSSGPMSLINFFVLNRFPYFNSDRSGKGGNLTLQ